MAFIRLSGALVGWPFGFALAAQLLQISQVLPVSNQVLVVFLMATACAILGWLGAPYVTVAPARLVLRQIHAMSAGDLLTRMQKEATVTVEISEVDPVAPTNDAKLIALARTLGVPVLSNGHALNRIAEL